MFEVCSNFRADNPNFNLFYMWRKLFALYSLTWPVPFRDHQGGRNSVEQAHCTQGVVKRYRDPHGLASGIIFYWWLLPPIINTTNLTAPLLAVNTQCHRVHTMGKIKPYWRAHNFCPINNPHSCSQIYSSSLTWPVLLRDHSGGQDSVEQNHCTLVAVKRCRGAYAFANGLIFGSYYKPRR